MASRWAADRCASMKPRSVRAPAAVVQAAVAVRVAATAAAAVAATVVVVAAAASVAGNRRYRQTRLAFEGPGPPGPSFLAGDAGPASGAVAERPRDLAPP